MKEQLAHIPVDVRPQPVSYRARTGHVLRVETSKISDQMTKIQDYADQNNMRLNLDKTKLMLFNPCSSKDFMPEIKINETRIELVEESKLLGIIITSDLKWEAHTNYMIRRCNSKLWVIRRLKKLGASKEDLLDIYCKHVRSILEFAAPVWNPALTGEDIINLERIQKTVLHIILGEQYTSYSCALKSTGLLKLSDRRRQISSTFAKKAFRSPKFTTWFRPNPKVGGRRDQPQFCPPVARTERFQKAPICELIKILNSQ